MNPIKAFFYKRNLKKQGVILKEHTAVARVHFSGKATLEPFTRMKVALQKQCKTYVITFLQNSITLKALPM